MGLICFGSEGLNLGTVDFVSSLDFSAFLCYELSYAELLLLCSFICVFYVLLSCVINDE